MPISACVSETASMPRDMAGLGIPSFKHLARKMCLTKRYFLRASVSADVRELWKNSSNRHVATDQLIVSHASVAAASKSQKLDQRKSDVNHLFGFEVQGAAVKCVTESVSSKNIKIWSSTIDNLPTHLFNLARKALIQVLPQTSAANLSAGTESRTRPVHYVPREHRRQTNTFYPTAAAPQRFIDTQSVIATFCQYYFHGLKLASL
jgi:hypothetical protein